MAASLPPDGPRLVRFGRFELDVENRRLLADGETLKLQGKPFMILAMLVAQPGKLVSREQLRQTLWSADTYVDFEAGLNTAIRKLRDCLDDDAKSPAFIETVPRLGYRFIAQVSALEQPTLEATKTRSDALLETSHPIQSPPAPLRNPFRIPKGSLMLGGTLLLGAAAVLVTMFGWYRWRQPPSASGQIHSIAVLPLEDVSHPPEDYFADGMTSALIAELGRVKQLRVISNTSTVHYKDQHRSVRDIGTELNVDAVLEGSVERSGGQVRMNARLIDAGTEAEIWSHTYGVDARNILDLHHQLVSDVSKQVDRKTADDLAPSRRAAPVDPQVYENYLKGREAFDTWSVENLRTSAAYFEEATKLDPSFAPAWAGLANNYVLQSLFGLCPTTTGVDRARRAALEALKLDDSLSDAHVAMSSISIFDHRWSDAENEGKRAIELDPSSAIAHQYYGYLLSSLGRFDEAILEVKVAADLDPLSANKQNSLGATYYRAGRYDEALRYFQEVPDPDENSVFRRRRMAAIYERRGNQQQAAEQLIAILKLAKETTAESSFEHDLQLHGYDAAKRDFLLGEISRFNAGVKAGRPMLSLPLAADYAALGDKKRAIRWLMTAFEQQDPTLGYLAVDDRFVSLRTEPEFFELLRLLHLDSVEERLALNRYYFESPTTSRQNQ
jgi:TolB-like protein/DNA-binding winged helix-turn-helix (wHTH) protein/tetratricopeptide (TPR) repeat protein